MYIKSLVKLHRPCNNKYAIVSKMTMISLVRAIMIVNNRIQVKSSILMLVF